MKADIAILAPASADDISRLADLHRASLPESILTCLGVGAVERYYGVVTGSSEELVVVARVGGVIEGGAVVTRRHDTLLRRFALRAPFRLAVELLTGLLGSHELRHRCWRRLGEREPDMLGGVPELVQIFTATVLRGQGIGHAILEVGERELRRQGIPTYTIRTLRDGNEPGIRFYLREGFQAVGEVAAFGDPYLIMRKDLSHHV